MKAWNYLCNKVDSFLKAEGIVGGIGGISAFVSSLYNVKKVLPVLKAVAKKLAIPLAVVCAIVGNAKNSLEDNLENKDGNEWYQFNWYVKYTVQYITQQPSIMYLSAYCFMATL